MNDYKPDGWPTVVPRLFADDPAALVAFIKAAFDATGDLSGGRPAELRLGDSIIMVSDGGGLRDPLSACLYVYVPDADAAYNRAVSAGAQPIEAPADMVYGDRRAMVRDPWGNHWQIATRNCTRP